MTKRAAAAAVTDVNKLQEGVQNCIDQYIVCSVYCLAGMTVLESKKLWQS